MPRIFDNIKQQLLPALQHTIKTSQRADFCVGYFNLRGWKNIQEDVDRWMGGEFSQCRLLVGMQKLPQDELRELLSAQETPEISNALAARIRKKLVDEFREQLTVGTPTNQDEIALRKLVEQIKAGKVVVKLFLRHQLHAKLYLLFKDEQDTPRVGYLGSSNLTFAGLSRQGELNVDVIDSDASLKLADWFKDRWEDRFCVDISKDLVDVVSESWAREDLIPPYYIYLKMAYHLSQEARTGLSEFRVPADLRGKLLEFQEAAVKIAAHHIHKRNGVLVGDVVGLGKTLIGTAIARVFDDDLGYDTLIICPKNLVKMWESYKDNYRMRARVMSVSRVIRELPNLRRFRLVMIDESHNLRNREGKRYRAIQDYIQKNESKVVLLTATPYNKSYLDLSSQLRLFVPEDEPLSLKPERLLRELGEVEFTRQHQAPLRSLAAFEKSEYPEDWQDLMRLYMVRRTRSFIKTNYAQTESDGRKYLVFQDGRRSYFPERRPRTAKFTFDETNPNDQYARMYAPGVVDTINHLKLPRYGLGQKTYINSAAKSLSATEKKLLENLSKAGMRLVGFSRTGLFKRLESSGDVFMLSVVRHILRNYIFLHAIENGLPLPLGTQDAALLDSRFEDEDKDGDLGDLFDVESEDLEDENSEGTETPINSGIHSDTDFKQEAAKVYQMYAGKFKKRFHWLRAEIFKPALAKHLREDALALMGILETCGAWDASKDAKLAELLRLVLEEYPQGKVLVFTQFADTVRYLEEQLAKRGVTAIAGATGESADPTGLAWRFSPVSNEKRSEVKPQDELRVLIATDVLSEGQNLQDCNVVVNYDLPWAIIRLIQRAGRVDRIGQQAGQIFAHTFLPAEGVERIIRLRERLKNRLKENAEVVGSDEAFFEDDGDNQVILDLYNEKAGILDGDEAETEVDLASYAFQIWKNATDANPRLQKLIPDLPPVVFSAREHTATPREPTGALVYMRTAQGNDSLGWINQDGESVTESQFTILRAAACSIDTPGLPRAENHHALVQKGVQLLSQADRSSGGQLGRPSGAKFRTYERLKQYAEQVRGTLWDTQELRLALQALYDSPLRTVAVDTLNRQLRSGMPNDQLASLVMALHGEGRLVAQTDDSENVQEPKILCSLGLQKLDG